MSFSEAKFRSLGPKNQAKKLADILKNIILNLPENWKAILLEYRQYCRWIGRENKVPPLNKLEAHRLVEIYEYWRGEAGLGGEKDLYSHLTFKDTQEAIAETIPWTVWMHNLRSGHNVGSIIRTTDCMGLEGAWLSGYTAPIENKSVNSGAMGAQEWVSSQRFESAEDVLDNLNGLPLIVLETSPDAISADEYQWPESGVILVGNEELGVPPDLVDRADQIVTIPQYGRKASLNVANAYSIAAWCVRRYFER